ncbi:MAG: indolepyruvate oxidoreductase subunit beta [Oscillospiraceae bacterium]|nr:indolepyruvate oxidoreductase subunit beta [Oscillospiraceae bacterium]
MNTPTKSVMIVGVGGQGSLLASRLLGRVLLNRGYDVKVSEVHGMSQRGGSVVTYVRYGDKVFSPIVDEGGAEIIISFELLEAARALPFLANGGIIVSNTQKIDPMPVIIGAAAYPEGLEAKISAAAEALGGRLDAFDALATAQEAGNAKAVNIALMGRASRHFDIAEGEWLEALGQVVPERLLEVNKKAFALGAAANTATA